MLQCPKCRQRENFIVYEEFTAETQHYVQGGKIVDFYDNLESVSPTGRILIKCDVCGHKWHPRKNTIETIEELIYDSI